MTGSTRKRGKTWTAYWSFTDPASGARKQGSKGGFRLKAEAAAYISTVLPAVQSGTYKPDGRSTVAELLNQWMAAKASEGS
jgi:hypothetical protein